MPGFQLNDRIRDLGIPVMRPFAVLFPALFAANNTPNPDTAPGEAECPI
jgi:hypothetical protein